MSLNTSWTIEQRYRRLEDISQSERESMTLSRQQDTSFPCYHIAPSFGLLNDPNGLCYFNGEHHIFYQWTPVGPVHGMKYWYHLSTKDFIHFTDHGIGLHPDEDYDSHGVYSGGALVEGDRVLLFFTGNKRDENWNRVPTQCFATMFLNNEIKKNGIIIENEHYTEHFRDPKVWKKDDIYFMVVGAQTQNEKGSMALYESENLLTWQHKGPIKTKYTDLGYMWECPDFFELDGQAVMLFSPQGVQSSDPYDFKNIYSVAYLVGDRLNLSTIELEGHHDILQPDYGFDFYAPQTYLDGSGRRILIAWVGLPDIDTPSVKYQWAGMLSIPRELTLEDGFLIQKPLTELQSLRKEEVVFSQTHKIENGSFLVQLDIEDKEFELELSNLKGERIVFSATRGEFQLDRSEMSHLYAEKFGTVRKAPRLINNQLLEMYVDNSVIEIFINDGKHTMTSRFFIDNLENISIKGIEYAKLFYMDRIDGLYSSLKEN